MADQYQVVGECAHVNVTGIGGVQAVQLLYKGAFLPEGVDPARLKHLVDSGLVGKVDGEPIAPNAAIEQNPNTGESLVGTSSHGQGDGSEGDGLNAGLSEEQRQAQRKAADEAAALEQKRAAAKAKLPADGSVPDGRAADAVFVEYLVARGYSRDEVEKASSADLKKLAKDAAAK